MLHRTHIRHAVAVAVVAAGASAAAVLHIPSAARASAPQPPSAGMTSLGVAAAPTGARRTAVRTAAFCPPCVTLFKKLLRGFVFRGRRVASNHARDTAQRAARAWTRHEVVTWFCQRYSAQFGHDIDRWRYATYYDDRAAWWWRYCAANGY